MNEENNKMNFKGFIKEYRITLLVVLIGLIIVSILLWYKFVYIKNGNNDIPSDNTQQEQPNDKDNEASRKRYKVTYIKNDKVQHVKHVRKGEKAFYYDEGKIDGYVFWGWYLDDEKFDFDTPITSDITLTAKYLPIEEMAISFSQHRTYFELKEVLKKGKIVDSFNGIDLIASTYSGKEELYINYPREDIWITDIAEDIDGDYYVIEDYSFKKGKDNYYIVDYENQKFLVKESFEDVSCHYHSDVSFASCNGGEKTIVKRNDKYGLLSLTTGQKILDVKYDYIKEENEYLIVTYHNKMGIYSLDGKAIWNFDKDLIYAYGFDDFESDGGFFAVKDDVIAFYDKNLNPIPLQKILPQIQEENIWLATFMDIGDNPYPAISYVDIHSLEDFEIKGLQYNGNEYNGKYYILCDLDAVYNYNYYKENGKERTIFYVLNPDTSKFTAIPNSDFTGLETCELEW